MDGVQPDVDRRRLLRRRRQPGTHGYSNGDHQELRWLIDGPYAETKEQLGGYYLVEAADLDAAIEIASRVPIPVGSFEVRPVGFRPDAADSPPSV